MDLLRKMTMFFVFLMLFAVAYSVEGAYFTAINPSAVNMGMGEMGGVADIWEDNPNSVFSNPAKSAFQQGFRMGYIRDQWLNELESYPDIYLTLASVGYTYKGIGITLPLPNARRDFGLEFDYGMQEITDENGNPIALVGSYDGYASYNISVRPLQYLKTNLISEDQFDFSVGYTFNHLISEIGYDYDSEQSLKTTGNKHDLGLMMVYRTKPVNRYFNKMETTFGYKAMNFTDARLDFDDGSSDKIYTDNQWGFACRFAQTKHPQYSYINPMSDAYSCMLSYGQAKNNVYGMGLELGVFDMVYGRLGYYSDEKGDVNGLSQGFGLNFPYYDKFQIGINYAKFPGGDIQEYQESYDINLKININ